MKNKARERQALCNTAEKLVIIARGVTLVIMNRALIHVVLLALSLPVLWAQADQYKKPAPVQAYQNNELRFRYRPNVEMHDKTGSSTAALEDQARHLHIENRAELLLSMSSDPDDRAAGWHSVTIVAYPRDAYSDLDDARAEAKMSSWVGGGSESDPALGRKVIISGQTFSVSLFVVEVDGVRKASVVWTTIRTGKLLSFAFAGNSPEQLQKLTESMKTVQFF